MTDAPLAPVKPRRRLRWFLAAGLLAALGWFAPAIIANSPLRQHLLPTLAPDYPATITIDTASLGWVSPVVLRGVAFHDLDGKPLLKNATITTGESLLEILTNSETVHPIRIEGAELDVRFRADGSNLEDVAEPFLDPTSTIWPGVALEMTGSTLSLSTEGNDEKNVYSDLRISVQKSHEQQTAYEITLAANSGGGKFDATLSWTPPAELTDPAAGGGRLELHTEKFPLQQLHAILSRTAITERLSAELNSNFQADWKTGKEDNQFAATIELASGPLELTSSSLAAGERLRARYLKSRGKVSYQHGKLSLDRVQLASDLAQVELNGTADLTTVGEGTAWPAMVGVLAGNPCEIHGQADLALLAATLPETLHVRAGTKITGGKVKWHLSHKGDTDDSPWEGKLETSGLSAINDGQEVKWDRPIQLSFSVKPQLSGAAAARLICNADFLKLSLRAAPGGVALHATCDLDRLASQAGQFIDLDQVKLAGQLGAVLELSRDDTLFTADLNANVRGLHLAGFGDAVWDEPQLKVFGSATGLVRNAQLERIEQADLQVSATDYELDAVLVAPTDWHNGQQTLPLNINLQGDLATLTSRLQSVLPLDEQQVSGMIELQAAVDLASNKITYRDANIDIANLTIQNPQRRIHQSRLKIQSSGTVDLTAGRISSASTLIDTSTLQAKASDLRLDFGSEQSSLAGQINLAGRLDETWVLLQPTSPSPVSGNMTGRLQFRVENGITQAKHQIVINDFSILAQPGNPPPNHTASLISNRTEPAAIWNERQLRLEGEATYDPAGDLVGIKTLHAAAEGWKLAARGGIDELSGAMSLKMDGTLDCDWEQLLSQHRDLIGDDIAMTGRGPRKFSLYGPLASSQESLLTALTARVELGWETANVYGLDAGKGQLFAQLQDGIVRTARLDIPVSDGRLTAAPQLLFDRQPALFALPAGPVIQNVRLTPEMCHSWLKYVAPMLADSTRVEGRLSAEMTAAKVPLDEWRNSNLAGNLTIHSAHVRPGPLAQMFLDVAQQAKSIVQRSPGSQIINPDAAVMKVGEQKVNFRMLRGRMHHDNLEITVRDVVLRSRGSVGLDETLALIVELPIQNSWLKDDRLVAALQGQVVEVPITGTLTKPKLDNRVLRDLGKKIATEAGAKLLQNELEGQLRRFFRKK